MRNYLRAECSKAFRRFYFHMALLVGLLGVGLLLLSCWLTYHWGNSGISFQSTAQMLVVVQRRPVCHAFNGRYRILRAV